MVNQIVEVAEATDVRYGVQSMLARGRDFPSATAALLSGIGVQPHARRELDLRMTLEWGKPWQPPTGLVPEVVVGAGPHGLIYAAIRQAKGVPVIVLDGSDRVGGAFAVSDGPAFWLNSRNRPGPGGLPGEGLGLNVLPGCPLQPSMIGGGEYQTNDQLAWTIRANFAALGIEVHTDCKVVNIEREDEDDEGPTDDPYLVVTFERNGQEYEVYARRVVLATGLGAPRRLRRDPSDPIPRMVSFNEFMARMDEPFPLQGMDRVAVLGAGDSGKTVVESLLGQGPSTNMSVAALDFPRQIDWYGCNYSDQATWCRDNRGRYSRIGKALGGRITPYAKTAYYPQPGFNTAMVGPRSYDWVVDCIGFLPDRPLRGVLGEFQEHPVINRGRIVGRKSSGSEVYEVGPAAQLGITERDRNAVAALRNISENATSLFRYAPLTAALAEALPMTRPVAG